MQVAIRRCLAILFRLVIFQTIGAGLFSQSLGPERQIQQHPRDDAAADLESARRAVQAHNGEAALRLLAAIPSNVSNALQIAMLHAEALYWSGQRPASLAQIDELERQTGNDAHAQAALGLLLARLAEYSRAETAFARAVAIRPADFPTLFNLGLAASKAGHFGRAEQAFESALKQRPQSVDCLLNLGEVYSAQRLYPQAAEMLARAAESAPARGDVQLSLARSLEHAGYVGDAALAFDRYLALNPMDDTARRDRAVVYASTGSVEKALSELAAYGDRHPQDPLAPYYIALLLETSDPATSLASVSKALQLDPALAPASLLRGRLLLTAGKPAEAVAELEGALRCLPNEAALLQQLGIAYLALDRPESAEEVLRRAVALAPEDDKLLRILGRALMQLDRKQEGLAAFARARQLGSRPLLIQQNSGALDLLRLPPDQRRLRQIEVFTKAMAERPTDRDLKLKLGQLCLAAGRPDQALPVFRALLQLQPSAQVARNAAEALAAGRQFSLALEFYRSTEAEEPAARVGAALTLCQMGRPGEGLAELTPVPPESRQPEFHLVRAVLLDALGQANEAAEELDRGFRSSNVSPALLLSAARLLIANARKADALKLLERADPAWDDVQLARAWLLGEMGRTTEAQALVRNAESLRPEWGKPYVVEALLFEQAGRPVRALGAIETAIALGWSAVSVSRRATELRAVAGSGGKAPRGLLKRTGLEDPVAADLFILSAGF